MSWRATKGWRRIVSFMRLRREVNPPYSETLFCLNTLPKQADARYRWLDGAIWDDKLVWID